MSKMIKADMYNHISSKTLEGEGDSEGMRTKQKEELFTNPLIDKKMFEKHKNKAIQELVNITSNPGMKRSKTLDKVEPPKKFATSQDAQQFKDKFNEFGKEIMKFENNNKRQD